MAYVLHYLFSLSFISNRICFGSFSTSHTGTASSTTSIHTTSATVDSWPETLVPEPYGALAASTAAWQFLSSAHLLGDWCMWVTNFLTGGMKSVSTWMAYHPACTAKCRTWQIHHIQNQPSAWHPAATILAAPSVVITGWKRSLSMPSISAHTRSHISEIVCWLCGRSRNGRVPKE